MNKVVINTCYGGYRLSEEAANWLIEHGIDESYYKDFNEKYIHHELSYNVPRHHPLLVKCVEELGTEKASGIFAYLKVVEIDSDVYRIDEYDGMESVETPNDIYWNNVNEL